MSHIFHLFWIPGFSLIEQYLTVSKTILYEIFFHPDAERVTGNIQLGWNGLRIEVFKRGAILMTRDGFNTNGAH